MNDLKNRLRKIEFLSKDVDGILISSSNHDPNFFYFTNSAFNGIFYYNFNKPILFTTSMDKKIAKKSWIKDVIQIEKLEDIKKYVKGNTGINKKHVSAFSYDKLKKVCKCRDISEELEKTRMNKTKYEIQCIKKSCEISRKIWEKTEKEIRDKTEIEIKNFIELQMTRFAVTPSFPTIVASGKNIAYPHHEPCKIKIKQPLLIDFGVKYNGYCSDITRTIGSKYEEIIRRVIKNVVDEIEIGKRCKDSDTLARKILGKHERNFITSLGHGIGIDIHERPNLSKNSEDIFSENTTFTIEPGIYVKNGIRIENDYLLTKKGVINLTKF